MFCHTSRGRCTTLNGMCMLQSVNYQTTVEVHLKVVGRLSYRWHTDTTISDYIIISLTREVIIK